MANDMREALQSLLGFRALDAAQLEHIATFTTIRIVRAGETVFCQGEPSPFCFGVLSGEVLIQRVSYESQFPPKVLGLVGPGGIFGESAMREDASRPAMATAAKDGKLAVVRGASLREWLRQNPTLKEAILAAVPVPSAVAPEDLPS